MGRKAHPVGLRLGIIKDHRAHWYAEDTEYTALLKEDLMIRDFLRLKNERGSVSAVDLERLPAAKQVSVRIWTAKPGIIIGRKGANVNQMRKDLEDLTGKKVHIDVQEIEEPDLDAYLVADSIAQQIERRISHKRAMKQAIRRAMRAGAQGIMITCAGRLANAEMARLETQREGRVPRHTLRADIDYARAEALTTFGRIGVKVWIYKGDVVPKPREEMALEY
ncbi:MAG: 30S ribosomal protein S3 [Anaerolineae bacterium]